jgi:hypothetical protein
MIKATDFAAGERLDDQEIDRRCDERLKEGKRLGRGYAEISMPRHSVPRALEMLAEAGFTTRVDRTRSPAPDVEDTIVAEVPAKATHRGEPASGRKGRE